MARIDFSSATPVQEDFNGIERLVPPIDFDSAKPVSGVEQATFSALDSSNIFMDTAKELFAGIETLPTMASKGLSFIGNVMISEAKSDTTPILPGITAQWRRKKPADPVYGERASQKVDDFFVKFGTQLKQIGDTATKFYEDAANKGIESPNPAVMMGWSRPYRKTISLAARNLPTLGVAAAVSAVTKNPLLGASTFFPMTANDMYEEAINHGVNPYKATDIAILDGTVQTALENIVLGNWMKGGHIVKRVLRTAIQEGLVEEGSQQLFDNTLKILSWKDDKPIKDRLFDGLAESILAGTVSGGALGAFQAPSVDDFRYDLHQEIINEGLKQEVPPEEISQTLDAVDEIIDKTVGITTNISEYEITQEDKDDLLVIQDMMSYAEPNQTLRTDEGYTRLGGGHIAHFLKGERSSALKTILDKIEKGKKLTKKQEAKMQELLDGYRKEVKNSSEEKASTEKKYSIEDEEENPPQPTEGKVSKQKAAYSVAPGQEAPEGEQPGRTGAKKVIPPETAKGEMSWEKAEAWVVNLGRNIQGIFEREIGPKLNVSTRLKRFLGVYYPSLGPNGLIRIKSLADAQTLFHEVGHFLDDALSGMVGWNIPKQKQAREELIKVTKFLNPFEERYVPVIDKETGLPKISKKTGKPLMKQDSYTAYRRSSVELFAQYVSLYTSDPAMAKQLAPNFTAIVEAEIARNAEFAYVVNKMREFEAQFKPIKDYVKALRKIPEFNKKINDWSEKGNILQELWRGKVGNRVWELFSKGLENIGNKVGLKAFFERGGLNETVFDILRQRRKLIHGQQERVKEEVVDPISKLSKEDQQKVSESLQRFGETMEDTDLANLTEEARKELALWGNEARKLGLLDDGVFWNNVGQYFPFFYETKEFEKNKRNFGYFPSKQIRARFGSLKHKMTDEEFGIKVLESQFGTWPSGKEKIAQYSKTELEQIGRNAREELGLIKTAAYPLQRRIFDMIEMVYTVKAFNTIATIPGITGLKQQEGFAKMPEGKKYGALSGEYVSEDLVKEVSRWSEMKTDIGTFIRNANSLWKMFKVPYNPSAVARNIVTNEIMAWMGDVPVWNPKVQFNGIKSFTTRDATYKLLRDNGLYHNSYSEEELKMLAFQVEADPSNPREQILVWANKIYEGIKIPGKLYGAIEDASKTIIARYVIDSGGTPEQAVDFADKLLFDYSQVSEAVSYARQAPLPFITWSAKVLPRLVEFAIRKPEKYIFMMAAIGIFNALSRSILGIGKDDEENVKPDYIRGKSTLLVPGLDVNGDLNWIDLTYFLPWGSWMPVENGKVKIPDIFTMSNPLLTLYNAYVTGYDPFYGEIGPEYLTDEERMAEKNKYVMKSLLPNIVATTPGKLINSDKPDKHGRKKELAKILSGEFAGVRFIADTSAYRGKIQKRLTMDFGKGKAFIMNQVKSGEITKEQAEVKIKKLKEKLIKDKKSH